MHLALAPRVSPSSLSADPACRTRRLLQRWSQSPLQTPASHAAATSATTDATLASYPPSRPPRPPSCLAHRLPGPPTCQPTQPSHTHRRTRRRTEPPAAHADALAAAHTSHARCNRRQARRRDPHRTHSPLDPANNSRPSPDTARRIHLLHPPTHTTLHSPPWTRLPRPPRLPLSPPPTPDRLCLSRNLRMT